MSHLRLLSAALVTSALAFLGCDSRVPPDCTQTLTCNNGGGGGGNGGGGGGGGTTDGGGTDGGGGGIDAGIIADIKHLALCSPVHLRGVVVVAVDNKFVSTDETTQFWVVDPARPTQGIFVDKFFKDEPSILNPAVGDVLDIDGFLGIASRFDQVKGYRLQVENQHDCQPVNSGKLVITRTGTTTPPADNEAPSGFGVTTDGGVRANFELAGTRVHVPGVLKVTNAYPVALRRASSVPADATYFGFEITGGILVNDVHTRSLLPDGGSCDWRGRVLDGGDVTFPNGIRGVWDSYTYTPAYDGGTSCSNKGCDAGYFPGSEEKSGYVLYPQSCLEDFDGADAGY